MGREREKGYDTDESVTSYSSTISESQTTFQRIKRTIQTRLKGTWDSIDEEGTITRIIFTKTHVTLKKYKPIRAVSQDIVKKNKKEQETKGNLLKEQYRKKQKQNIPITENDLPNAVPHRYEKIESKDEKQEEKKRTNLIKEAKDKINFIIHHSELITNEYIIVLERKRRYRLLEASFATNCRYQIKCFTTDSADPITYHDFYLQYEPNMHYKQLQFNLVLKMMADENSLFLEEPILLTKGWVKLICSSTQASGNTNKPSIEGSKIIVHWYCSTPNEGDWIGLFNSSANIDNYEQYTYITKSKLKGTFENGSLPFYGKIVFNVPSSLGEFRARYIREIADPKDSVLLSMENESIYTPYGESREWIRLGPRLIMKVCYYQTGMEVEWKCQTTNSYLPWTSPGNFFWNRPWIAIYSSTSKSDRDYIDYRRVAKQAQITNNYYTGKVFFQDIDELSMIENVRFVYDNVTLCSVESHNFENLRSDNIADILSVGNNY